MLLLLDAELGNETAESGAEAHALQALSRKSKAPRDARQRLECARFTAAITVQPALLPNAEVEEGSAHASRAVFRALAEHRETLDVANDFVP